MSGQRSRRLQDSGELSIGKIDRLRAATLTLMDGANVNATEAASFIASLLVDVMTSIADEVERQGDAKAFASLRSAAAFMGETMTTISNLRTAAEWHAEADKAMTASQQEAH